jgi:hypothetical protein
LLLGYDGLALFMLHWLLLASSWVLWLCVQPTVISQHASMAWFGIDSVMHDCHSTCPFVGATHPL